MHPMSVTRTPGDDPWMVRVTRSSEPGAHGMATVTRLTGVNLAEEDPTPGVHPYLLERGRMTRDAATGAWQVVRTRIEARRDADARAAVADAYAAALAFARSGAAPTTGSPTAIDRPGLVTLEVGDDAWTFAANAAPDAVLAVEQLLQLTASR